ncbi:MAG: hypothetical protein RLZZ117_703 [Cyanobacteriota bacterium]|jgi:hypothetical protein
MVAETETETETKTIQSVNEAGNSLREPKEHWIRPVD